MDPKQNGNQPLDPKLQEVYDRVMGVNANGDTVSSTPTPASSPTPVTASAGPSMTTTPLSATPPPATPFPTVDVTVSSSSPTQSPILPIPNVVPASNPSANLGQTPTQPESSLPQASMPSPKPVDHPVPSAPMDTMSSTISMPHVIPHDTQTIKIGTGGNPVGVAAKGKGGISPVILIFGAFAFLAVYAFFWIKFFGYSIPFISQ